MWQIVYDILTKIVLLSTISLGTVERIIDGKNRKGDIEQLYMTFTKLCKLAISVYLPVKILLGKTREPYRCYHKFSADKCKVGGIGLITDHALVDYHFIPMMEGVASLAELLFSKGLVSKFLRSQKLAGFGHIGQKIYAGRRAVMTLNCTPREMFLFLTTETHAIPEQLNIVIGETHVELHFNKGIKKGESVITTNPPCLGLTQPHKQFIPATSVSQNPVNVLS